MFIAYNVNYFFKKKSKIFSQVFVSVCVYTYNYIRFKW